MVGQTVLPSLLQKFDGFPWLVDFERLQFCSRSFLCVGTARRWGFNASLSSLFCVWRDAKPLSRAGCEATGAANLQRFNARNIMANDVSVFIPQVLAQSVTILRQNCIMPRLINTDYSAQVAEYGDTVDIPIPSQVATRDVTPGQTTPAPNNDVKPKKTQLSLDKWREAPFSMNDKELGSVMRGVAPRQLEEAVKAISNDIDTSILNLYKEIYGTAGTAGTVPFASSTAEAQQAFRTLNIQLAPRDNRRIVMDPFAEANAIGLPVFQQYLQAGTTETLVNATIGHKLGFDWYQDQNVTRHSAGSAAGFLVNQVGHAVGDNTVVVDSGTGTFAVGDIFTVAGDSQTYVVASHANSIVTYSPSAKTAFADNAALTKIASHTVNLAFHRDAFGFASRPMTDVFQGGSEIMSMVDPISGVVLRLEVSRQHKQTTWSLDALWGVKSVRPELACRILGQ